MHRPRTYRRQLLMNTDWRASDLMQEFKQSPLSKSVDRSYKLQFSRTINAIPGLILFELRVSGDHIQDTTPSGNHSSESSLYVQKILLNAFSDIVLTQQLRSIGDHAQLRWNSSFSSNHQIVHWTHPPANIYLPIFCYKLFARALNVIPGLLLFQFRMSCDQIWNTTLSGYHSNDGSL